LSKRLETNKHSNIDGQLAERKVTGGAERATGRPRATPLHSVGGVEKFFWDGLALIKRSTSVDGQKATDATSYLNEPAVTGGNPILADDDVLFNDMLGTTLGSVKNGTFNEIALTSFGANESQTSKPPVAHRFFTGKPHVDGLGYAFLFRNYRPELGKWQTSDPLGYPDGWNNFAYVSNKVISTVDLFGLIKFTPHNQTENFAVKRWVSLGNNWYHDNIKFNGVTIELETGETDLIARAYVINTIYLRNGVPSLSTLGPYPVPTGLPAGGVNYEDKDPLAWTSVTYEVKIYYSYKKDGVQQAERVRTYSATITPTPKPE
jgi:RHS repeat-associated protein